MASASYAQPRRSRRAGPAGKVRRVRWDRLGRIAMLFVLLALAFLYISAGTRMLSTLRQSHRDDAKVAAMERDHRELLRQHNALSSQSTLEEQARKLGMMRANEQPYVVGNLPAN
jgi:cell division protein FtsL